ncbi:hypothetical protein SEUCBS140593_003574 [Sporothrix eucalyptigena]|uniref:DUF7702 domain-containing protein n=1 Tax=Sporothrix eucalyptigena TaxID=1812306 RepID=A0ABP0BH11_9PEZI
MSTYTLSPPSTSVINLTIADLVIYALLFIPTAWVTWKHGKTGMVCWPIFVSYFGLRFTADAYLIANRHTPETYNEVVIMTNAGSLACLSLTIIGLVYEANIILPLPPRSRTEKIILGVTHLANTGGIAVATYGGAPSATTTTGVINASLNQIGNCLMLFVMFTICWWLWPTWQRLMTVPNHPNFRNAQVLLFAAVAAMPFQLVRLAYNTTYAFIRVPSLDPVMGSFATRLVLLFFMQLAVALACTTGGILSAKVVPRSALMGDDLILKEHNSGASTVNYVPAVDLENVAANGRQETGIFSHELHQLRPARSV